MSTPTLYDWLGGIDALNRLTQEFYRRVRADELLGPVFAGMNDEHPRHVALFLAEVMGGPALYSQEHGGHPAMIRHHLNKHLSEPMRRRWINLLMDSYTDLGLPADPEFASSLVGYLEWGSRLAVMNSQSGATVWENAPMPRWGWGETKGPYSPGKPGS
ncbi:group II truncated hemoglobin [Oryzicola mucosus]|nr:group II truncated hemoglobin [Oryzicola mucosus]